MKWETIFGWLMTRYGWTPQQIGRLTMAQLQMCLQSDDEPGGPGPQMTVAEAVAMARRKAGQAEKKE